MMYLYNANETMKLLGHQCTADLLCADGIAAEDFKNIIDAHKQNGTDSFYEFGIDAFMLGYIYGKRAEREKRKK